MDQAKFTVTRRQTGRVIDAASCTTLAAAAAMAAYFAKHYPEELGFDVQINIERNCLCARFLSPA